MTPETQRQALRRLKIIAGQVQALEKQIEEDRYCMDVLGLSLSVQKALRSLDGLVIEGHLRTHGSSITANRGPLTAMGLSAAVLLLPLVIFTGIDRNWYA
ncbi:MAG: metal-sensitive transcriptional regulator [Chloroflexi bacterium]|nr:metal-sensitive transcriptional regulator [Chloroflexota bacterium]